MKAFRKIAPVLALAIALPLASQAIAQNQSQNVQFPKGASSTTLNGQIKGYAIRDYVLRASAGQNMTVRLKASNRSTYFNVLPFGSETAMFVGSTSGDNFSGRLPRTGKYTVRVYLMRNAARRNEISNYKLTIGVSGRGSILSPGRPNAGFSGMQGMDSIRAIDLLSERGFAGVDAFTSGNTQYGIYYKRSTRQCVQMTMANTRVVDVREIGTHPRCR